MIHCIRGANVFSEKCGQWKWKQTAPERPFPFRFCGLRAENRGGTGHGTGERAGVTLNDWPSRACLERVLVRSHIRTTHVRHVTSDVWPDAG